MSILSDKIAQYSANLNRAIQFSETYKLPPTVTGSSSAGAWSKFDSTPTGFTTGGPGGNGYWSFPFGTTGSAMSNIVSTTANAEFAGYTDGDFTFGFWFRTGAVWPSGVNTIVMHSTGNSLNNNSVHITASGYGGGGKKLVVNFTGSYLVVGPTLTENTWYYFAARRVAATNTITLYLNAEPIQTWTGTTTQTATELRFGSGTAQGNTGTWAISGYHQYTSAVGPNEIKEIYYAGSGGILASADPMTATASSPDSTVSLVTNINFTQTSATANALQTEPTIATTIGDNVYVTTSIIVDATFPENVSVYAEANKNILVDIMEASADIVNNVTVSGGNSESYSANPMLASAEMREEIALPRSPMFATALMVNPTLNIDENYYNKVMSKNPVIYSQGNNDGIAPVPDYPNSQTWVGNKGSWGNLTYNNFKPSLNYTAIVPSTGDLGLIAEGLSWASTGWQQITIWNEWDGGLLESFLDTGNYTYEFWARHKGHHKFGNLLIGVTADNRLAVSIRETDPGWGLDYYVDGIGKRYYFYTSTGIQDERVYFSPAFQPENWYYVTITCTSTQNGFEYKMYLNGQIFASVTTGLKNTKNVYTNTVIQSGIVSTYIPIPDNAEFVDTPDERLWTSTTSENLPYSLDEWAVSPSPLSSAEIQERFLFVDSKNPDVQRYAELLTADANIIEPSAFLVNSEVFFPGQPVTANAEIVDPTLIAGKTYQHSSTPATANVETIDPVISTGFNYSATALIAYAESLEGFALNDIYYNYVMANINPYRYVTFDAANEFIDYGSDNDYSVAPVIVGGNIVQPAFGMNGKSAKTSGISYTTGGVILKESEYNDTWGTDTGNYHSSYWIKRAADDPSTTGLRIIQSIFSPANGAYGILYQYQNKLHLELSDGISRSTHTTANDVDLFDYNRHLVVINHELSGQTGIVSVYVDMNLVMYFTVPHDIGIIYNSDTYLEPNTEANNFNRFAIGCLIAPFANTGLPVIPANTKIYVDEIVWAKSLISAQGVMDLYDAMPDTTNAFYPAQAMIATDDLPMPSVSTEVVFVTDFAAANGEFVEPVLYIEKNNEFMAEPFIANADMYNAIRSEVIVINAEVFFASAYTPDGEVFIAIPAESMNANIEMVDRRDLEEGIKVNNNLIANTPSAWLRYIRATDINSIRAMTEVK